MKMAYLLYTNAAGETECKGVSFAETETEATENLLREWGERAEALRERVQVIDVTPGTVVKYLRIW